MDAPSRTLWVGFDWADEEHQVCVVDGDGRKVAAFAVPHQAKALNDLPARLRSLGDVAGVAIETPRHLVARKLLAEGFAVYPINPDVSHGWCEALSTAGATSDPSQAFALADGLRHHHARLRRLAPDDGETRKLALLCETEEDLINQRTAFVNELQACLKEYYPAVFEWFDDWTSPSAWDFAVAFPTPGALATAPKKRLYGFLKGHRLKLSPKWQGRVERRGEAADWPRDLTAEAAMPLRVKALVAMLRTLKKQLDDLHRQIKAAFAEHRDGALFASLPRGGEKLAVRLLVHFGSERDRYESARSVERLAGCVPVTKQSGKTKRISFRRACQKPFRNTVHQYALASLQGSEWARACYDMLRERGQSNARALRAVGGRWIHIIYRMWMSGTTYNEGIYMASLVRHGSPIIDWMRSQEKLAESQKTP